MSERVRALCLLSCLLGLAGPASANPFTVDSLADDNSGGTLRDGVVATNADADDDTIDFDAMGIPADSTITLNAVNGTLDVSDTLLVDGSTATNLTIEGDGSFPLFTNAAPLTLRDLTLQNGDLVTDDALIFDQSAQDATFSGDVSGTGSLQKTGTAKVTLEGTNSYAGTTSVTGGVLEGDTDSLPGDILVTDDGMDETETILFNQAVDGTFASVVSGTGALEKDGAGVLTLSGANTYSGGTTVTGGTLQGDTTSLQGDIANNATLTFDQAVDGTFDGAISGSGALVKDGAGVLTLTGANSHSGGTTVMTGTLQGDAAALQENIQNDASLIFDQTADGTHSGAISGTGDLLKDGAGVLTLTGTNSYSGGTTVMTGTLQGNATALQGDIQNDAAVVFDQSGAGLYAGALSGAGTLEKRGTGTLGVSDAGGFTGATTVSAGRLDLTGDLGGDVQVDSGATVGGTGAIAGSLTADGTVAPGLSIGQLDSDSAALNAGSELEVELDDSGASDLLAVTNTASLDALSTVRVLPAPGDYTGGVTSTVVNAGTLDAPVLPIVIDDFAFLDVMLAIAGNELQVTVAPTPGANFESFAQTQNQRSVGRVLDLETPTATGDLDVVLQELMTLSQSEIVDALDDLAGETLTAFSTPQLAAQQRLFDTIDNRMRGFAADGPPRAGPAAIGFGATSSLYRSPFGGVGSAFGDVLGAAPQSFDKPEQDSGAWVDGYGIFGDADEDGDARDLEYAVYGASLGYDHPVLSSLLVGGAVGYARLDADLNGRSGDSATADVVQGALYASYANERFHFGMAGRFAYDFFDTKRRIRFGGIDRQAKADYDGWEAGGHAELGVLAYEAGGFRIEPMARFDYTRLDYDSFDEKNAGSVGFNVESRDIDSLLSGVGARVYGSFKMDDESWITPVLHARWAHEFGDTDRKIEARLSGGTTGASFDIQGAEIGRDSLVAGFGWVVTLGKDLHIATGYDLRWNQELLQHGVRLNLAVTF